LNWSAFLLPLLSRPVVFLNPAKQPDEHQKAMQAPAESANTHNRLISRLNAPEKEGKKDWDGSGSSCGPKLISYAPIGAYEMRAEQQEQAAEQSDPECRKCRHVGNELRSSHCAIARRSSTREGAWRHRAEGAEHQASGWGVPRHSNIRHFTSSLVCTSPAYHQNA